MEYIRDSFLEQYVMEPTREQATLDLVQWNETRIINDLTVRDPLGRSDRSIVEFKIQLKSEKLKPNTSVLCLNKRDDSGMREELAHVDLEQKRSGGTIEEQWRTFKAIFHGAQQKYIPVIMKDCRERDNQPWISEEIKEDIKLKESLHRVTKISGKREDWENFKGQQKAMEKTIKKKSSEDKNR